MLLTTALVTLTLPLVSRNELKPRSFPPLSGTSVVPAGLSGDGTFDIAAALEQRRAGAVPNPFRDRSGVGVPAAIIPIRVGAVACGASGEAPPGCVINGEVCEPGDTLQGLLVRAIDSAGVRFEFDGIQFQAPVDRAVKVRLPR